MRTIIHSGIVAVAVLSSFAAASARPQSDLGDNARQLSSYDFNNPQEVKAFWEELGRSGK